MKLKLEVKTIDGEPPDEPIVGEFDGRGGGVGRSKRNEFVLPDRYVSGRHAHIVLREDAFFIIDTSQNGVFLNGAEEPVGWCKTAPLNDGDQLSIGRCELHAHVGPSIDDVATMEILRDILKELPSRQDASGSGATVSDKTTEIPRPAISDQTVEIPRSAVSDQTVEIPRPTVSDETVEIPRPEFSEGPTLGEAANADARAASGAELFESRDRAEDATTSMATFSNDVLIVDDDEEIGFFVKFMLERSGLTVASVADGLAALDYIDTQSPSRMVVLDLQLPYLDGYQIINTLRAHKQWRGVPIIILSAMSGEQEVVRALNAGALDYIVKPFKPTELVARLQRFLPNE